MGIALFILTGVVVFAGLMLLSIIISARFSSERKNHKMELPECKCENFAQCNVWCQLKQHYYERNRQ